MPKLTEEQIKEWEHLAATWDWWGIAFTDCPDRQCEKDIEFLNEAIYTRIENHYQAMGFKVDSDEFEDMIHAGGDAMRNWLNKVLADD